MRVVEDHPRAELWSHDESRFDRKSPLDRSQRKRENCAAAFYAIESPWERRFADIDNRRRHRDGDALGANFAPANPAPLFMVSTITDWNLMRQNAAPKHLTSGSCAQPIVVDPLGLCNVYAITK